ncbi:4,5-DOPA dioxygenase extradiol [Marinomonas transparens]|uniref:4,5-DOPA dioxygenase extradiol n=1 Tax=Marinomonas transparens TaxID=2795388 RepID=A0A934JS80_9GAMM|nr:4,5-DOPA dioxygenase extradiol [Marinomonas transparens]MBJ7537336.1 4,5-DOPA dioxygenase extradiol [Marinomonas transparens]
MNRRDLFKSVMALVTAHFATHSLFAQKGSGKSVLEPSAMPVLFIGHGSPMNALRNTPFTQHLKKLGHDLPQPRAILVVSAHWVANGPRLSGSSHPDTIYDFGGFPDDLYQIRYPSPGAPELAARVAKGLKTDQGEVDATRGLDHGAWTVLRHLYPQADIPVIQLAMSARLTMAEHMALATELQALRQEGILILASGNIVHNLGATNRTPGAMNVEWAIEFDGIIKEALLQRDLTQLLALDKSKYPLWNIAHPTIEHYVPLLYALGASTEEDVIRFPYEGFESTSISMRSVMFG